MSVIIRPIPSLTSGTGTLELYCSVCDRYFARYKDTPAGMCMAVEHQGRHAKDCETGGIVSEWEDVARELYEALKDVMDNGVLCDCWRCTSPAYDGLCGYGERAEAQTKAAIRRYERLTGADE